jgi:uncharacterized protein (TIGR02996 family)
VSDRQPLLNAILAAPADDGPRLVFADWCDENSAPERGEFIRVQVARARLPEPELKCIGPLPGFGDHADRAGGRCGRCSKMPGLCEYHVLEDREAELLRTFQLAPPCYRPQETNVHARYAWAGPVANLDDPNHQGWQFIRGFVESITCPAADWLQHADAITAEHPVREVMLTDRPTRLGDYVDVTTLADLRRYMARYVHRSRWPGVTFLLSRTALVRARPFFAAAAARPEILESLRQSVARTVRRMARPRRDTGHLRNLIAYDPGDAP